MAKMFRISCGAADRNFRWEMIGRKIIKPRPELPGQMRMEELFDADLSGMRGIAGGDD